MHQFPDSVDESLELNNGVSRLQKSAEIKKAAELDLVTLKKAEQLKLVKDIEEMKSKLNEIELKLGEVSFESLLCFSCVFAAFTCRNITNR